MTPEMDACRECGLIHTWNEHDVAGGPCPACGDDNCPVGDDESCCAACFQVWKDAPTRVGLPDGPWPMTWTCRVCGFPNHLTDPTCLGCGERPTPPGGHS